ncbi:MAG: aminoacyl-histidine dipeptidase [Bradymonadales bacterium]|nr:aminoacyl-histidine dipeptidase [Bradymonadales bacterium]
MNPLLNDLKPTTLWNHFDQLTRLPRGSGNERLASQYVLSIARHHHLSAQVDERGNTVVYLPASPGHQSAPTVILQGHLDMVCEKNDEVAHDFTTDPIRLRRDGEWLMADGTTLGADNGIGVSAALAFIDTPQLVHGPLELLFTVEEETGLYGAAALSPDLIHGKILLNLDSEEIGVATIGCAGGRDVSGSLSVRWLPTPADRIGLEVRVGGLRGGHSGIDIHLNRGNAIRILADLLNRALEMELRFELATLSGGNQRNAIPREARTLLALHPDDQQPFAQLAREVQSDARLIASSADPEISLSTSSASSPGQVMDNTASLVRLLAAIPTGVLAMSQQIPGLVETSNNLGVVTTESESISIICASRSSVAPALAQTTRSLAAILRLAGIQPVLSNGYPGWRPDPDSPLVQTVADVHQRLFGAKIKLEACHAGLECGLLGEKLPGLQMISLGPTICSPHSPDERVHLPSVEEFWRLLTAVLQALT